MNLSKDSLKWLYVLNHYYTSDHQCIHLTDQVIEELTLEKLITTVFGTLTKKITEKGKDFIANLPVEEKNNLLLESLDCGIHLFEEMRLYFSSISLGELATFLVHDDWWVRYESKQAFDIKNKQ